MSRGTLTIQFNDEQIDAEVEMSFTRMSPKEALYTKQIWLDRFAALHLSLDPRFEYDGEDDLGEWEEGVTRATTVSSSL